MIDHALSSKRFNLYKRGMRFLFPRFFGVVWAACLSLSGSILLASDYEQTLGLEGLQLINIRSSFTLHDPRTAAPGLAAGLSRTYLDGYNRPDSSGNIGEGLPGLLNRTGYWGYSYNNQVNIAAGTIGMHLLQPALEPYYESGVKKSQQAAGLHYQIIRQKVARSYGLELRAVRLIFSEDNQNILTVPLTLLTDSYKLGGIIPPSAPLSGGYAVVPYASRIGDVPERSLSMVTGETVGIRQLALRGWLVRLGGVVRIVESKQTRLELHGGPALLNGTASFALAERFTTQAITAPLSEVVQGTRHKVALGYYAGLAIRSGLQKKWQITASADLLNVGHFTIGASAASARLNLSQGVLLGLGLGRRF